MERTATSWQVLVLTAALAAGTTEAGAHDVQGAAPAETRVTPQSPEAEAALVFSADVVVDESIVDDRGRLVETRPQTRYRLARRQVGGGIQTEITHPPARLFAKGPLTDPRSGYRYVFDQDFTRPRIYDPAGTLVPTGGASGPVLPGSGARASSTLVFADRDVRSRRSQLVERLGAPVGTIGGRDRYLSHEGELSAETLVEPSSMLPVEINVLRGEALAQRLALSYGRLPGGRWYLATVRSESALPGPSGRRFVSRLTHLNVVSTEAR
ncbi:MAG: hypothetical protein ABI880_10415 [Acidobacteriota bacterium]